MIKYIVGIAVLISMLGSCSSPPAEEYIRTQQGLVKGQGSAVEGVSSWLGLPYAAAPVGELRWRAPQAPAPWQGVRNTDAFGNRCMQTNPWPDMIWNSEKEDEDCLYLSIWAPEKAEKLPVMLWIHGGGYSSGSGDEERHDGSALASKDVVVITINYRLGILGFLAHPELSAETESASSGNYALLDMIAALDWVQKNISAFGGDPGNVTIFGESAGSFAVSSLMASPLAAGLFHKAIGQSGAMLSKDEKNLNDAELIGAHFSASVGASSLEELRAMTATELIDVSRKGAHEISAIIDGYVLPEKPLDIFRAGHQNDVPLLAGWTSAESKWVNASLAELNTMLETNFPENIETAKKVYPAQTEEDAFQMAVNMTSDSWIVYPTWKWIELALQTGSSPVYRYLFDQVMATPDGPVPDNDPGAAHATDIAFVFNVLDYTGNPISAGDQATADVMVEYWTNFARSGDPNGQSLPIWPAFSSNNGNRVMHLSSSSSAEVEHERERMEFLDSLQ